MSCAQCIAVSQMFIKSLQHEPNAGHLNMNVYLQVVSAGFPEAGPFQEVERAMSFEL